MTTELIRVASKPGDYKICINCNKLNWYENEKCCEFFCGHEEFDSELVLQYVDAEYHYYEEEGYSETDIDGIEIEC